MQKIMQDFSYDISTFIISALTTALGALVMFIQKRMSGKINELDSRMRELETEAVNEDKVRQLIIDAVDPIKEGQDVIKGDVKQILRVLLERS